MSTRIFGTGTSTIQEIGRLKIGWNKSCIREYKIAFSKESSCAIFFESMSIMSTFHFEGTLICKCGKLMRPDKDVMNRSEGTIPPLIYDCDT